MYNLPHVKCCSFSSLHRRCIKVLRFKLKMPLGKKTNSRLLGQCGELTHPSPSPRSLNLSLNTWAPAEFFPEGGKTAWTDKKIYFSARRRRQQKFSRFFRRFRLNLRVFDASAEDSSEKFRVFCTEQHMTSSFSNSRGGSNCTRLPPSGRLSLNTFRKLS